VSAMMSFFLSAQNSFFGFQTVFLNLKINLMATLKKIDGLIQSLAAVVWRRIIGITIVPHTNILKIIIFQKIFSFATFLLRK
jgi:hypothetical protein